MPLRSGEHRLRCRLGPVHRRLWVRVFSGQTPHHFFCCLIRQPLPESLHAALKLDLNATVSTDAGELWPGVPVGHARLVEDFIGRGGIHEMQSCSKCRQFSIPRNHRDVVADAAFVLLGEHRNQASLPLPFGGAIAGREEEHETVEPRLELRLQEADHADHHVPNDLMPAQQVIVHVGLSRKTNVAAQRGQEQPVRIHLADNEMVDVEELGDLLHGEVCLHRPIRMKVSDGFVTE
mmetsp:Transcript_25449/g.74207  ORF Transcript_25449/g.74207 Transcript_25449/m.74207 type:complete len:235 (+) Transcript_25449:380-1084(+)